MMRSCTQSVDIPGIKISLVNSGFRFHLLPCCQLTPPWSSHIENNVIYPIHCIVLKENQQNDIVSIETHALLLQMQGGISWTVLQQQHSYIHEMNVLRIPA